MTRFTKNAKKLASNSLTVAMAVPLKKLPRIVATTLSNKHRIFKRLIEICVNKKLEVQTQKNTQNFHPKLSL
jgi:hypothetical protein